MRLGKSRNNDTNFLINDKNNSITYNGNNESIVSYKSIPKRT